MGSGIGADAILAATLLPAMRVGGDVKIPEPGSPKLLASIGTIQDIFRSWEQRFPVYSSYRRVAIHAPGRLTPLAGPGRGTALFFTGGVDSFYSLLRHREEID